MNNVQEQWTANEMAELERTLSRMPGQMDARSFDQNTEANQAGPDSSRPMKRGAVLYRFSRPWEPPDVYDEALIRAMTVDGLMMVTFTPLKGLSAVALDSREDPESPINHFGFILSQ